ncbi:MAG: 4Fe-4S dicluster domain-containing protein [Smithellaceae bacterium]|nr:4Fe-4S dicluster domain-containing protein [Smithellaceae bacterium]
MAFKPEVNQKKCRGCETCVDLCTAGVFTMIKRKSVVVNAEVCLGCEVCVGECKETAIKVTELRTSLSETCSFLLRDLPEN